MAEHADIIDAAKAVYDMRMRTAWGVGQTKRPAWDQATPSFRDEIIAEVKATLKALMTKPVTPTMISAQSIGYAGASIYEAMALQRLKDLGIDP